MHAHAPARDLQGGVLPDGACLAQVCCIILTASTRTMKVGQETGATRSRTCMCKHLRWASIRTEIANSMQRRKLWGHSMWYHCSLVFHRPGHASKLLAISWKVMPLSLKGPINLSVNDITDLLSLCLDPWPSCNCPSEGWCTKWNRYTWHCNGVPSVSGCRKPIVMEDIEERALSTSHPPPHFWKRYVDGTLVAHPSSLDMIQP